MILPGETFCANSKEQEFFFPSKSLGPKTVDTQHFNKEHYPHTKFTPVYESSFRANLHTCSPKSGF